MMVDKRNDLIRPRQGFRMIEDGSLPTRACGECGLVVYLVPAGMWLHWGTCEEPCREVAPLEGVSDGQEGAMLAADGLDTVS